MKQEFNLIPNVDLLMCSIKKVEQSDQDAGGSNEVFNVEKHNQPGKSPKKPRRALKRFGEMSEEDVLKMKLPEHLDYNLDILFVRKFIYYFKYKYIIYM